MLEEGDYEAVTVEAMLSRRPKASVHFWVRIEEPRKVKKVFLDWRAPLTDVFEMFSIDPNTGIEAEEVFEWLVCPDLEWLPVVATIERVYSEADKRRTPTITGLRAVQV